MLLKRCKSIHQSTAWMNDIPLSKSETRRVPEEALVTYPCTADRCRWANAVVRLVSLGFNSSACECWRKWNEKHSPFVVINNACRLAYTRTLKRQCVVTSDDWLDVEIHYSSLISTKILQHFNRPKCFDNFSSNKIKEKLLLLKIKVHGQSLFFLCRLSPKLTVIYLTFDSQKQNEQFCWY